MSARRSYGPVVILPTAEILRDYLPTDMDLSGKAFPHSTWQDVFTSIEKNHAAPFPAIWSEFRASVRKRVRTPLVLGVRAGRKVVLNGHHRIWAAHVESVAFLPTVTKDKPCH